MKLSDSLGKRHLIKVRSRVERCSKCGRKLSKYNMSHSCFSHNVVDDDKVSDKLKTVMRKRKLLKEIREARECTR